jgi:hypothetical protein
VEVCGVERRGHQGLDDVVPEVVMELLGPDLRIVRGGEHDASRNARYASAPRSCQVPNPSRGIDAPLDSLTAGPDGPA